MKLSHLFEEPKSWFDDPKQNEIVDWLRANADFVNRYAISFDADGALSYDGFLAIKANAPMIKYPLGAVKELFVRCTNDDSTVHGQLSSLVNLPKHVAKTLSLGGQSIAKIDAPLSCDDYLNLAYNKLTSLKNIHRHVTCREIAVWNNPVKDSILGLLLIPGVKIIDDGRNAALADDEEFKDLHRALKIVARFTGKGRSGVLAAQQELLDAGLDDFAEI